MIQTCKAIEVVADDQFEKMALGPLQEFEPKNSSVLLTENGFKPREGTLPVAIHVIKNSDYEKFQAYAATLNVEERSQGCNFWDRFKQIFCMPVKCCCGVCGFCCEVCLDADLSSEDSGSSAVIGAVSRNTLNALANS